MKLKRYRIFSSPSIHNIDITIKKIENLLGPLYLLGWLLGLLELFLFIGKPPNQAKKEALVTLLLILLSLELDNSSRREDFWPKDKSTVINRAVDTINIFGWANRDKSLSSKSLLLLKLVSVGTGYTLSNDLFNFKYKTEAGIKDSTDG
jgi:hypothetical protein